MGSRSVFHADLRKILGFILRGYKEKQSVLSFLIQRQLCSCLWRVWVWLLRIRTETEIKSKTTAEAEEKNGVSAEILQTENLADQKEI